MSWSPLHLHRARDKSGRSPVRMSAAAEKRGRRRVYLTISQQAFDLPWLIAGNEVEIMRGASDHIGLLRISDGRMLRLGNTAQRGRVQLVLWQMDGVLAGVWPQTECAAELQGEALVVTLPFWAGGTAPRVPVARTQPVTSVPASSRAGSPLPWGEIVNGRTRA